MIIPQQYGQTIIWLNVEPKDANENTILALSAILIEKMSETGTETGSCGDGTNCIS